MAREFNLSGYFTFKEGKLVPVDWLAESNGVSTKTIQNVLSDNRSILAAQGLRIDLVKKHTVCDKEGRPLDQTELETFLNKFENDKARNAKRYPIAITRVVEALRLGNGTVGTDELRAAGFELKASQNHLAALKNYIDAEGYKFQEHSYYILGPNSGGRE